jgi:hypothetical protein
VGSKRFEERKVHQAEPKEFRMLGLASGRCGLLTSGKVVRPPALQPEAAAGAIAVRVLLSEQRIRNLAAKFDGALRYFQAAGGIYPERHRTQLQQRLYLPLRSARKACANGSLFEIRRGAFVIVHSSAGRAALLAKRGFDFRALVFRKILHQRQGPRQVLLRVAIGILHQRLARRQAAIVNGPAVIAALLKVDRQFGRDLLQMVRISGFLKLPDAPVQHDPARMRHACALYVGAIGLVGNLFAVGGVRAGIVLIARGRSGLRVFNSNRRLGMRHFPGERSGRGMGPSVLLAAFSFQSPEKLGLSAAMAAVARPAATRDIVSRNFIANLRMLYSYRNAMPGSTRVARRAGSQQARNATAASRRMTLP